MKRTLELSIPSENCVDLQDHERLGFREPGIGDDLLEQRDRGKTGVSLGGWGCHLGFPAILRLLKLLRLLRSWASLGYHRTLGWASR